MRRTEGYNQVYSLSIFSNHPWEKQGFLCGSVGKESTCNAGDLGSIPGLGRSPGEGKGYPLQYSGLGNSMDCIVHVVLKSQTHPFGASCSFSEICIYDILKPSYGDHTAKMTPNKIYYEYVHKYIYVLVVEANKYICKPHHL